MADHRITDFVDQKAIDRLNELREGVEAVKRAYVEAAAELAKGLDVKVKGFADLEKTGQALSSAQGKAATATEHLLGNIAEQKKVLAETTATIQRQLAEQTKLNEAQREAYASSDKIKGILEKINGTYENQVKNLVRTNAQIEANRKAVKDNDAALRAGTISAQEHDEAMVRLTMEARQLAQEKQKLTTLLKNEEREMQSTEGSYNRLSQQLELMKKAYKELSEEEKASDVGKELDAAIKGLDNHLKDLAESMGEYQRNVGNYAVAQGNVKKGLKEMVLELANLKLSYAQMSDAEKNSAEGRKMAAYIEELTEKAGALRDAIGDTNAAISNAASDTRGFDQISAGIQLLINGFGAATGAAQMLGLSEEDLVEVQANLQAAIVASNALSSIQASLQKESALMQGVHAIQTKAAAAAESIKTAAVGKGVVATKAATIAQRAFNAVAKANPYVLLAAAVVTVVGALYAFTKGAKEAREEEARRQKQLEESRQAHEDFKRAVVQSAGEQIAVYLQMKTQWESLRDEMSKSRFIDETREKWRKLGKEIGSVNEMEKVFRDGTEGIVEAILKRAMIDAYKSRITKIGEEVADAIEANSGKNVTYRPLRNVVAGKTAVSGANQGGSFAFGDLTPQELAAVKDQLSWHGNKFGAGGYNTISQEGIDRINQMRNDAALANAQQKRDKAMDDGLAKIDEYQRQIDAWTKDVNDIMDSLPGKNVDNGGDGAAGGKGSVPALELPEAKTEAELAEIVLKIRQQSVNDRLSLEEEGTQEWLDLKREAIEMERQIQLSSAAKAKEAASKQIEESAQAGIITEEKKAKMLLEIESNYRDRAKAINQKAANEIEMAYEEMAARRMESIEDAAAAEQTRLDMAHQRSLLAIKQAYEESLSAAGNDAEERARIEEEYRNRQMRLNEEYAVDAVRLKINAIEEMLDCETLSVQERGRLESDLAELKMKLENAVADAHISENNREYESERKLTDKIGKEMEKRMALAEKWLQSSQQAISQIASLANAIYAGKIQKIEEEQEAQQEAADAEQQRISDLVESKAITEEEGEARKRAAEAKTAERSEQLEKRKQQLEYKQAVWDKANNLAQAGINTAVAILASAKMGFPAAIPFVAMAAALGAIQMATIMATPIPKYAKGTDFHKGGLAIVGDAGKREIISFGGQMYLTPDKPTVVDIPRGAEVIPDANSMLAGTGDLAEANPVLPLAKHSGVAYNFTNIEKRIERTNDLIGDISRQMKNLRRDTLRAQFESFKSKI